MKTINQKKVAVLLYGYARTYKITANSLIEKVLEPNKADLFVHCYDNEGVSLCCDGNIASLTEHKIRYSRREDRMGKKVTPQSLEKAYGVYLKAKKIISYNSGYFKGLTKGMAQVSPYPLERFFSLYFNISEAFKLLEDYMREQGTQYDVVILARPDLHFYSNINVSEYDLNCLNIPQYGGNIKYNGINDLYYVTSYKNVQRMEYIPWHDVPFSDQLIISSYDNMRDSITLFEHLQEYSDFGVPVCHPETCIYYHLAYRKNLQVKTIRILYEILRNNFVDQINGSIAYYSGQAKRGQENSVIAPKRT